jgi:phosphate transport system permease protein
MIYTLTLPTIIILAAVWYFLGRQRARNIAEESGGMRAMHSLPSHYGMFVAMNWTVPALLIFVCWRMVEESVLTGIVTRSLPPELQHLPPNELTLALNEIKNIAFGGFSGTNSSPYVHRAVEAFMAKRGLFRTLAAGLSFAAGFIPAVFALRSINKDLRARNLVEKAGMIFLILCSGVAILTTIGIFFSVLFESIRFFHAIPLLDFLTGLEWSPQTAIRADQVGSSGAFGAVPVFAGTILIAIIAMAVAIPIGLLSAIYLSEYASDRLRTWAKPVMEILAGIPTVVYGFFAALTVAPLIRAGGQLFGLNVSSESALAAGLVMGIMIIPFVSSLSDDVIHAVPQSLRDGSLGLGATRFETIRHVVIPAALPGIVGSILLAVSRAIGETMIVVMAAGLSANLSFNPLTAVTTVTVQIVTLLVGDQEFDSPKTLAAFALGLLLFVFTLILNFIALRVVRRYREQYE